MANPPVGFLGTAEATDNGSDYNANTFLVWSILAGVRTMQPCKILSVTNAGGISPVGFVSLQPLVNQLDGYGNAEPHGPLNNVPYFRLQGGANAIIIDPQVGDIGFAGFADRDISSVKATKGRANPGSYRQFDMADAVYFGGILNGTPNQYIAFSASGIALLSPTQITMTAPQIVANASTSFTVNSPQSNFSGAVIIQGLLSWLAGMTGTILSGVASTITGAVAFIGTMTSNGHTIDNTHTHNGVQPGSGSSGEVN